MQTLWVIISLAVVAVVAFVLFRAFTSKNQTTDSGLPLKDAISSVITGIEPNSVVLERLKRIAANATVHPAILPGEGMTITNDVRAKNLNQIVGCHLKNVTLTISTSNANSGIWTDRVSTLTTDSEEVAKPDVWSPIYNQVGSYDWATGNVTIISNTTLKF